jgi:SAM-dependent methyltransferase
MTMQGYDNSSYGDAFADVFDDWYGDISDVAVAVAALARLSAQAGPLPIVELGVGTGRLALPLAQLVHPTPVIGIDSSAAMLRQLDGKHDQNPLVTILGDMIDDLPDGPLSLVFVAFNTFFNLDSQQRQLACMQAVAQRLDTNGCLVIEAMVPDQPARTGSHVEVKSITRDRVVLSVATYDGTQQSAEGQFIEFTETGGVRLRPWSIRYTSPGELDTMAANAGLRLRHRWETFAGMPFTNDSTRHVSIYSPT